MNNRYPHAPDMNPAVIPRGYLYGPTQMPTSNPAYPSGITFGPNTSASPYAPINSHFAATADINNRYPHAADMNLSGIPRSYPYGTTQMPTCNPAYASAIGFVPSAAASPYSTITSHFPSTSGNLYPVTSEDKSVQTGSYLNADLSVDSLSKDFSKLLDKGQNCDAEIKCGEHTVKAHKVVLCARSDVFNAMLKSNMVEGQTGIVEIKDIDINYIEDFIRYLYTDVIPELTFERAKILYETGDKYDVRSLVLRCSEYLQDNLTTENACQCLALADAHSDLKLKHKVMAYILDKKLYLQDEYWSSFCETYPKVANEVYKLSYKNNAEGKSP